MTTSVTINPLNNIANNENIVNDYFGIDECVGDGGIEFDDNWSRPYFRARTRLLADANYGFF